MNLKDMTKEEIEALSYTDLTCILLTENKKPMSTAEIFKKICEILGYSDAEYSEKIGTLNTFRTLYTEDSNLEIYFLPSLKINDNKNEWIATLNIYYNNGTNKKVIEKSSGTFEIINNELIYYRTKTMQRESNIEIPNVSAFVIKNQRLILKENYLKNYEKSIILK